MEIKPKVLFVAFHEPTVMDLASGSDYFHYKAICDNGFEVKVIGPFADRPIPLERLAERLYQRTGNRYPKFKMTTAWVASQATNLAVREWKPDLVFTIVPFPLIFYKEQAPCIYRLDTTFYGVEEFWPTYGKLGLWASMWQEKHAYRHCARVITTSEWSRNILARIYNVPKERIRFYPMPSALPMEIVPERADIPSWKALQGPFRLLMVGRDYRRKGMDIAMDVTRMLNADGIPAELTICGTQGQSDQFIKFVGQYKKSDPKELKEYVEWYRQAHLLIHPAYFEAAGIVPGEAAAFGTPTITNNAGGLATTVKDGVSGIVLPRGSPAEKYVEKIKELIANPEVYYQLCRTSRERYELELNWKVRGRWLGELIQEVIAEHHLKDHHE
ncbi:MAG: glycosyltransferase family 4 protein [Anaerolineales bacterium]